MPLEEVLARRKREAQATAKKRRMTMVGASSDTFNKIQIALRRASVEVREEEIREMRRKTLEQTSKPIIEEEMKSKNYLRRQTLATDINPILRFQMFKSSMNL